MNEDPTLRVAALKVLSERFAEAYRVARAELGKTMGTGDRTYARVGDQKIAAVFMTDPDVITWIGDEEAYGDWVAATYPEKITWDFKVIGSDEEVKAVLWDHAPALVKRVSIVDPDFTAQVRHASKAAEQAAGPNGELDVPGVVVQRPDAQLACRPRPGALAYVVDLIQRGELTLESLTVPELERGA